MSNTPSDAEIEKLAAEHLKAFAQFTGAGGALAEACAVLAKWSTPQPVAREPLTDEQKNAMWVAATIELPSPQNCYLRGMADAERAHGIGIKGGQHGTE